MPPKLGGYAQRDLTEYDSVCFLYSAWILVLFYIYYNNPESSRAGNAANLKKNQLEH